MIGHWWQAQSERDRRTLRWGAAVVALLLVWALVWHPLAQRRALLTAGLRDWPAEEVTEFARLLDRFVSDIDKTTSGENE